MCICPQMPCGCIRLVRIVLHILILLHRRSILAAAAGGQGSVALLSSASETSVSMTRSSQAESMFGSRCVCLAGFVL